MRVRPSSSRAQSASSRVARVAIPRPRASGRHPVADLAGAALAVDLHQAERAEQAIVGRVDREQMDRGAGCRLLRADGDEVLGVGARVRRRHERPARDLRVLAGGGERVGVLRPLRPQHQVAVAEGRQLHSIQCARCLVPPCAAVRALFWISAALLAWAQVGYGLFLAACGGWARAAARRSPADAVRPRVSLIVAAYNEEAVIEAKVRNALALDWPRDRLELIVAVDGGAEPGADATAERARAAGADRVLELPRRGKYRAQDAAVGGRERRAAGVLGRQRDVGAGRAAPARGGVRRSAGRLRLRAGAVRQRRRHQPGGPVLALRDVAARERVGARVGHRRQRRDLRRAPGGLPRRRRRARARPRVPVQHRQARPPRGLRGRGARDGEDGPDARGRVGAQAADDDPRVADRRARRPARPARLRAAVRADGRLAPAAALRLAAAARARRDRDAGAAAARAHVRGGGGRAGGGPGGRVRRRPRARTPAARGPLLRADDRRAGGRAVRLAAPRHATVGWEAPEGTR